jgi:hypothetical protein
MLRGVASILSGGNFVLSRSNVPAGLCSSCTIGNNGALSVMTLPAAFVSGVGVYMYFPQGQLNTGAGQGYAAGFYWVALSSNTAGTAYNITYTPSSNIDPAAPTAAQLAAGAMTSTGVGAYAGDTTDTVIARSVMLPGNTLGLNGMVEIMPLFATPNNSDPKTNAVTFGGTSVYSYNSNGSTYSSQPNIIVRNANSLSAQWAGNSAAGAGFGTSGVAMVMPAINTANAVNINTALKLGTASDYLFLVGQLVRVTP